MENQTELKWYQKPAGVIILLIFLWPVGIYLMWKNEFWSKQTRWIVTGVFPLLFLAQFIIVSNDRSCGCSDQELTNLARSLNLTKEQAREQCCRLQKIVDEMYK